MLSMGVTFRRQLLHFVSRFGLAAYLLSSVSGFLVVCWSCWIPNLVLISLHRFQGLGVAARHFGSVFKVADTGLRLGLGCFPLKCTF